MAKSTTKLNGKPFAHQFGDVNYMVDVDSPFVGITDPPEGTVPHIRLPFGLPCGSAKRAKWGLNVLMHECIHASKWRMSEKDVVMMASDITGLLWRLGYRRKVSRRASRPCSATRKK